MSLNEESSPLLHSEDTLGYLHGNASHSPSADISESYPHFNCKFSYGNETQDEAPEISTLEDETLSRKFKEISQRSSWDTFKTRLPYYLPCLKWIREYKFSYLSRDMITGITVATMLIPQALSYSHLAKVPPINALYTAMIPVILYSLFGTCRQLSLGPAALTSILVGHAVKAHGHLPDEYLSLAIALAFLVGLLTFICGFFRLGFLDSIISRALLSGFVIAAGVTIIIEQLDILMGIPVHWRSDSTTLHKAVYVLEHLGQLHPLSCYFGIASCMLLTSIHLAKNKYPHLSWIGHIPGILLVVVISIIASYLWDVGSQGVAILGVVERELPHLKFPKFNVDIAHDLFGPAITITVVGFVESLAAGKIYSTKYNYPVSANRELVAIGLANVVGCFFGTYPVFGSLTRSNVKDITGVRTSFSDLVTAAMVAITVAFLLPVFYYLPKPSMAAIVLIAASGLMDFRDIAFLWRSRAYKELVLCTLTFSITLIIGIDTGIIISVLVSLLFVLKSSTVPKVSVLGKIRGVDKFQDTREYPEAKLLDGVLLLKLEESLYFGNTGQIKDLLRRIENLGSLGLHPSESVVLPPIRHVIFDMKGVPSMDASAAQILYEIVSSYKSRNIDVCFVKIRNANYQLFAKCGLFDLVGHGMIFLKIKDALSFLHSRDVNFHSINSGIDV
eukprot:Sdes_comp19391_c0_seq2m10693